MDEKRSYYAIIPANVRYDKNLSANAKLLYGEISALCNDKGYCWSTNKYFSDLFGVSQKSISKWISTLISNGYLFVKIIYQKGSKEILERHLSIVKEPLEERCDTSSRDTPLVKEKFYTPMEEKFHTPMEEKLHTPMEEKLHTPMEEKLHTPMEEKLHTPMEEKFHTPMEEKFHTPGRKVLYPMEEKFQENITGTNTTVSKSVCQSKEIQDNDKLTDEIRERLKKQIDYDYFEDNYPDDLPGVNLLIDCMTNMLLTPTTRIGGYAQDREAIKPYIEKADAEKIQGFLEHMKGRSMRDVRNVSAYWQSSLIDYLRGQELTLLTV